MKKYSFGLLLVASLIFVAGCGEKASDYTDEFTPEQLTVVDFVDSVSALADQPDFKDHFTKAPSSKELAKFQEYKASVFTTEVSGNTATAEVDISKYGESTSVTKTWKLTKSGDSWKIEDAPLP